LAEWEAILADSDTCWAPVRTLEEVLDAPLFRERQMVTQVKAPGGRKSIALGVPIKLSDTPGSIRTPPVGFGENAGDILSEIGYTAQEIRSLEKKGVI
jgi:crotonobetainyl-CoA:carnitine CoA-transferase CaiB-like acyl-CoA transferase